MPKMDKDFTTIGRKSEDLQREWSRRYPRTKVPNTDIIYDTIFINVHSAELYVALRSPSRYA